MGGLLCWARRSAILQFDKVPTNPVHLSEFDSQMRKLIAAPGVTESLLSDKSGSMQQLCSVLAKQAWTAADRDWLLDLVESLYE
jgi:hypothetical protein